MSQHIGFLGGAFNPPHHGHIRPAREVLELLGLEWMLWIPSGGHPLKDPHTLAPAHHREAMVRLAITHEPRFEICTIESAKPTTSYTIDTLTELARRFPDKSRFFLMGADNLAELHLWRRWQELIHFAHIVVMSRPGHAPDLDSSQAGAFLKPYLVDDHEKLSPESGRQGNCALLMVPVDPQPISSTDVRQRLIAGQRVDALIPTDVAHYIAEHGLYSAEKKRPHESKLL